MTCRQLFLEKWLPALIPAVIGGMVIAGLVPYVQSNYAREAAIEEKRIATVENLSSATFNITHLLIRLSNLAAKDTPDVTEEDIEFYSADAKSTIEKIREFYGIFLDEAPSAKLYYGERTVNALNSFDVWLRRAMESIPGTNDFPTNASITKERDKFLTALRAELDL